MMETLTKVTSFYRSLSREKRIIFTVASALIFLSLLRAGVWVSSRFNAPTPNKYVKQLKNPNKGARMEAIYAVGTYGVKKAIPGLKNMLEKDSDPQIRRMAAISLGRLDKEYLVSCLASADPAVKDIAIDALMQLDKQNLTTIMERFKDEKKEGKLKLLGYLAKQPDARYAEVLLQRAEDTAEDMAVRLKCLEILRDAATADMAPRMLNIYYNDTDEGLRKAAQETVKFVKERNP